MRTVTRCEAIRSALSIHKLRGAVWSCLLLLVVAGGSFAANAQAEDWANWRGPRGDGTSLETNVPIKWSATENIAWKVAIPHAGHGSPIVWHDYVFVLGADLELNERRLSAFDRRSGRLLWDRAVCSPSAERIHRLNSHASSTPATDGERVYASFLDQKEMIIAAYDLSGNELWKVHPGAFASVHGYCSSPVLYKDKVIVNGDHDGEAYIVALDRATGKTLWKTPRENKTRSYCTPIIREIGGRTQMMLSGSKCVASYNPDDGSRHWIIDGPTEQFVASPLYAHNLLFITGGFPEHHTLAIDPTGRGNVTDSHIVWRHKNKGVSYVPSPIAVKDYFLVASDGGMGTCFDAKTGEIQWLERLGSHFSASLVAAEGRVYFTDDDGITKVIEPGPKLNVVAENSLGEPCYASPAISRGQIFVRTEKSLICIGKSATALGK
ncbi:MAG: PQQ-like beta-propeller repeat protein [Planctomycetales bacterium]|nr:PQQ-like beta-propeller repeat protein [Planctomycetales bacterium]